MNIVIGTAGHIDHGKTSLVKRLTSIDTDRLKEEKARGLSIDLGFAYIDLPGLEGNSRVGIVDVPGHEKFIKNMLSGITGIDIVLFVVAADDSIMPQTREHLDIINLLGIDRGIFVITKSDLVTEERLDEVRGDINSALEGTSLFGSEILNVSSVTGDGFNELKESIAKLCLLDKKTENKKIFRLPVDRSFTVKGFGTVVTGTVCSGTVSVGSEVAVFPKSSKTYRVRGLQSHGVEVGELGRGLRGAVNLSSIAVTDIKRGDVLLEKDYYDLSSKVYRVDCKFAILKTAKDLKNGAELKLYHYSKEVVTKVRTISKVIKKGSSSYGRLYLREPLPMLRGDRFILRETSENRTIGGGEVLLPYFTKQKLPKIKDNDRYFKCIDLSDLKKFSDYLLSSEVCSELGMAKKEYDYLLNLNSGDSTAEGLVELAGYYTSEDNIKYLEGKVVETIGKAGTSQVSSLDLYKGVYEVKARKTISPFFKIILDKMVKLGLLYKSNSGYTVEGEKSTATMPVLSDNEKTLLDKFNVGMASTKIADIEGLPYSKQQIKEIVFKLQKNKYIVRLTEGVYIISSSIDDAESKIIKFLKEKENIKVSEFRDLIGSGRKLAMEILDYFDREGVTLRSGDFRKLRK